MISQKLNCLFVIIIFVVLDYGVFFNFLSVALQ